MEFQVTIQHTAANEAGLLTFLTFVKDTYPAYIHSAFATKDGADDMKCGCTLVLGTLAACVTAIQAFKAQFSISYRLVIA